MTNHTAGEGSMLRLILTLVTLVFALPVIGSGETPPAVPQRAVLVTGASTGIGRKVTERLAADGYFVYAGARKDADLEALNKIKNVQAVRLDVTKQEDIDAAVATIKNAGRGLYALINNAGVATIGSLLENPQSEFDLNMDVNVAGPWRVTKGFIAVVDAEKSTIAI